VDRRAPRERAVSCSERDGPTRRFGVGYGRAMAVSLRPVCRSNVRPVCELRLSEHQRDLVAPAAYTVAESQYRPGAVLRTICLDDEPVGPDGAHAVLGIGWFSAMALDARWEFDPIVLARLPYGDPWRREVRIAEGADGNRYHLWRRAEDVVDGRPALGAEVIRARFALIGHADVRRELATDANPVTRESSLEAKGASSPTLAGEAVAYRHPDRLALGHKLELAAATGCFALRHGHTVEA
jgi:hypothetical protein